MAYRSDRRLAASDWNIFQNNVHGGTTLHQSENDTGLLQHWDFQTQASVSPISGQHRLDIDDSVRGVIDLAVPAAFKPDWFGGVFDTNQVATVSTEDVTANQNAGTTGGLAGSLGIGGFTNGDISVAGELDEYTLNVEAGKTYTINLFGNSSGNRNSLADSYLRVYTDAGLTNLLIENNNSIYNSTSDYLNSYVSFTVATDATLYVQASAVGLLTGEYTLIVEDETVERPRDSLDWGSSFYDTNISVYFAGGGARSMVA